MHCVCNTILLKIRWSLLNTVCVYNYYSFYELNYCMYICDAPGVYLRPTWFQYAVDLCKTTLVSVCKPFWILIRSLKTDLGQTLVLNGLTPSVWIYVPQSSSTLLGYVKPFLVSICKPLLILIRSLKTDLFKLWFELVWRPLFCYTSN